MKFSEIVRKAQGRLTKSQKKALRYILDHPEESVFLSSSGLAEKTGTSEATIIRLAQALGFDGFPALKKALQALLRDRLSTVSRLEHTAGHIKGDEDIIIKVFQQDIDNLTQTLKNVPIAVFKRVVQEIQKADRIFIVGLRTSHALALFMGMVLRYMQKDVRVLKPDHGEFWDHAIGWTKGDLVIGISFPRYTKTTVDALRYAKDRGVLCIGITDHPLAPLAQHCDLVLTARCDIDSYIESYTAPLSLINAIVTAVSLQDSDNTLHALKTFEAMWEERDIYVKL